MLIILENLCVRERCVQVKRERVYVCTENFCMCERERHERERERVYIHVNVYMCMCKRDFMYKKVFYLMFLGYVPIKRSFT